jgi:hypothetical protein
MIEALGIKDFQSIDTLAVACGPITVFVGESDSGKSAVVRALYALAFNDYPSDHLRAGKNRSADASQISVKIDGKTVTAHKGKARNGYLLVESALATHTEPETREWNRVGRDVPEEVVAALGWRTVELDDGSKFAPSIQRQFDGPFLLADSPSRVAKVLGSLTNISTLFSAIREGSRLEKQHRKAADVATEEAARHGDEAEALAAQAEALAHRAVEASEAQAAAEAAVEELLGLERLAERLSRSMDRVARDRSGLKSALAGRERLALPDLDPMFAQVAELTGVISGLELTSLTLHRAKADLEAAQTQRMVHGSALEAFMAEMRVCPVCERPLDHEEAHP